MLFGDQPDRRHLAKPVEQFLLQIADGDQLGPHRKIVQHEPASERAGRLASHQPAADDSDPHGLFRVTHVAGREINGPALARLPTNRPIVLVVVLVLVLDSSSWFSRTRTIRFMVPMRDSGIVELTHEPAPSPRPSPPIGERVAGGRVRGWFMVPMRA